MSVESREATKEKIIAAARIAGFDAIGFAKARPLLADSARLLSWIEAGRHGEMSWIARDPVRRAEPSEWVKTVIAFATSFAPLRWDPGEKKYASYAEGHDYHKTAKARMNPVCDVIRSCGGKAKKFVDTSAVLERAWAREAGLGFIGRNMMLISRDHGPNVYLSVIFTDLELPADESGTGTCGECTRCLDACPTSALDHDGLDARKCISYLTIEVKRPLEEAERKAAGDWTFGCDECVTVCPYTIRGLPAVRPKKRGVTRYLPLCENGIP